MDACMPIARSFGVAVACMQEPFDSLDEKYMLDLSADGQDNQLDNCLRMFNLDRLLGALFEVIETFVRNSPDNMLNWP